MSTGELERIERELGPGAFGRIVTADRRIGRGFVRGGLTRPDRIGRRAARDPGGSAQRYVTGLYRFLDSVLRETKPDIVFCYAVAGAPAVALAEICRVRGIPFCVPTYTRIGNGHVIDDDAAGRLPSVARRFERARDGHAPFAPSVLDAAREYLDAFRAAPVAPKSMAGSWTPSPSRSAATRAARSALSLSLLLHERRPAAVDGRESKSRENYSRLGLLFVEGSRDARVLHRRTTCLGSSSIFLFTSIRKLRPWCCRPGTRINSG